MLGKIIEAAVDVALVVAEAAHKIAVIVVKLFS